MEENYLWNKTGEDPEIERLEKTLAVFRYVETEAPALPAKIVPFERKTSRGFFRLGFGFTAFASLIIVCLGVWFQFSKGKIEVSQNQAKTIAPSIAEKTQDKIPVQKSDVSAINKVGTSKQNAEPKTVKIRKIVPSVVRQNTFAAKTEFKKPAIKLTREEKYAYNQLMLALSITGSKLKLVEDKIYGTEETKTTLENAR